jgi:hypothetical protein
VALVCNTDPTKIARFNFFSQMNHARKSMWEMLCQDRDLQVINAEKRQFGGTMDAEINNVIYMELYSGPKMAHGKYEKTNVVGSTDRDSIVYNHFRKSFYSCDWALQYNLDNLRCQTLL